MSVRKILTDPLDTHIYYYCFTWMFSFQYEIDISHITQVTSTNITCEIFIKPMSCLAVTSYLTFIHTHLLTWLTFAP